MGRVILFLTCLLCLASCKTTKYVDLPKDVHEVYINNTDTVHDSTYQYVFITEKVKGDTVFREKTEYKYRDRWRTHDSIVIQRDTVNNVVTVTEYKYKGLSWWEKILQVLIGMVVALIIYRLFIYFTNK